MSMKIDNIEQILRNFVTANVEDAGTNEEPNNFLSQLPLKSVEEINNFSMEIASEKRKFKKLVSLYSY